MKLNQFVKASIARELTDQIKYDITLPFIEYMLDKILEEMNKAIPLGIYQAHTEINHLMAPRYFTKEEAYDVLADALGKRGYRCDHDSKFNTIVIYW